MSINTNEACKAIAKTYTNTRLKRIVNVYQHQFDTFKTPGFGDYLRGSFCMMQVIQLLNDYCNANIEYDMDIRNHPMSRYFETEPLDSKLQYSRMGNFYFKVEKVKKDENDPGFQDILKKCIDYMNKLNMNTFYCFSCEFEFFHTIEESHKEIIRSKLMPNEFMENYIQEALDVMGLGNIEYTVIHIRCRDEVSFPAMTLLPESLAMLETKVTEYMKPNTYYLLLTNHNQLKDYFGKYTNIASRIGGVCHTGGACHNGDNPEAPDEAVRDTVLDYFLMTKAKAIIGFSPYKHGTGFSQETAKLYNIPHTMVFI